MPRVHASLARLLVRHASTARTCMVDSTSSSSSGHATPVHTHSRPQTPSNATPTTPSSLSSSGGALPGATVSAGSAVGGAVGGAGGGAGGAAAGSLSGITSSAVVNAVEAILVAAESLIR